jgi:hypothetical protein
MPAFTGMTTFRFFNYGEAWRDNFVAVNRFLVHCNYKVSMTKGQSALDRMMTLVE